MPRNTTGGSKHKSRANGEGNTARKNRTLIEKFIYDMTHDGSCEGIHVARVMRRVGDGRMEVMYHEDEMFHTIIAPIKGSLRGRGKSQAHIDTGSVILVSDTGMTSGIIHEIVAVFNAVQLATLVSAIPGLHPKIIEGDGQAPIDRGFEFAEEESDGDVDIDKV